MKDKYEYILNEKTAFRTRRTRLISGFEWSFYEHIRRTTLYKNSKFWKGPDDGSRPFKQKILPLLNVAYRAEGFDVKDIEPFVDDKKNYWKSFIVRKYHPRWARENEIDTFIDELVESYVDYGLALIKIMEGVRPEVVPLQRLSFADSADILTGPICERHEMSPSEIKKQKWDGGAIEKALLMTQKERTQEESKNETPGDFLEIFELHGELPAAWLRATDNGKPGNEYDFVQQIQIVTFYKDENNKKQGITLFSSREKSPYQALRRDPIPGRACGRGGAEELFEAQQWTNYAEIKIKEMLDLAALHIFQTADKKFETANKTTEMEVGEILVYEDGKPLMPVNTSTPNKGVSDAVAVVDGWGQSMRTTASADEPLLGTLPKSGTPFRSQALVTQQGLSIHSYRQGKIAIFVEQLYRDFFLKDLVRDMNKGQQFLSDLTVQDIQEVGENVVMNIVNRRLVDLVLSGQKITEEDQKIMANLMRDSIAKNKKRFLKIIKDELRSIPIDVRVNIVSKQEDLAGRVEKLNNIFATIFTNPQILQNPSFAKLFNEILESSGFSPLDFIGFIKPVAGVQAGAATEAATEVEPQPAELEV
jgi:hypothetical protein